MAICFVLWIKFGLVATVMQILYLPIQCNKKLELSSIDQIDLQFLSRDSKTESPLLDLDRAIYLLSVVLRAIYV